MQRIERTRRVGGLAAWLRLALILTMLGLLPAPALAAPAASGDLPCADVQWYPVTHTPITLRRCQAPASLTGDPSAVATAFLRQHHAAFGMPASLATLRQVDLQYGIDSTHILYQQTYAGLPVYGAYTSFHLNRNRQIQVIQNGYLPSLAVEMADAAVTGSEAVQISQEAIGFVRARGENPPPVQVILPSNDDTGRLTWQVTLLAAEPQGDWEVLVDATSGQVLKRYNRLVRARGDVYPPNPAQPSGDTDAGDPSWPDLTTIQLAGLDGSGWLRGEYADVTRPVGYRPASAYEPDGDFSYAPDDPRFEEVMVYYYIDRTQRYVQSLGYADSNTPPNGIRDRVTYASAHWFDQDQSFYSVSDDALHFGDGGVEDAEDADIIVHEYAHALQHDQLACWGDGQMDAIGEGFGDYLAASLFAGVGDDPACIAEWDSQGYATGPAQCLRRVDRSRQYPLDVTGDPHADGEIWSRALWDLRGLVGAKVADTLAVEANFYLPCGASLADAGRALLDADANVYGGAHAASIEQVLATRGLAPLPAPAVVTPAGNATLLPGGLETVAWQPSLDLPATYQVQYTLDADAIGTQSEDFGSGRLAAGFQTFGNRPWRVEAGAARAGAIQHGQTSGLAMSTTVAGAGTLSFRYRVSSEEEWDSFEFYLDDQLLLRASGQVDWTTFSTPLEPGSHRLLWRYHKDSTLSVGQDSAWMDDLVLENVSLATWHDADVFPNTTQANSVRWRVPSTSSTAVQVRVRSEAEGTLSFWAASRGTMFIEQPAAVSLSDFEALSGSGFSRRLPLVPWGLLGLLLAAAVGIALERMLHGQPS